MAKISPFKGVLYNKKKIKNIGAVTAPPYDVISERMRDELCRAHSHNIVRVILGREPASGGARRDKYKTAAGLLLKWMRQGVLKKDKTPSFYIYEQEYAYKGAIKKRIGFICLMRIEDPASSLVLPHEYTFPKPKEDRMNLIRATKANTSPIFCIFEDTGGAVTGIIRSYARGRRPEVEVSVEGVGHRIWRMREARFISKIKKGLDDKQVFIADGHHRYEVALGFRDEMRKKIGARRARKFDNVMVYLSNLTDQGLTIFSTYRVVKDLGAAKWPEVKKKLEKYFYVEEAKDKDAMFKGLEAAGDTYAFGVFFKNRRFYLLRLKDEAVLDKVISVKKTREWRKLNVTVLHFLIFGHILRIDKFSSNDRNIIYTRDEDHAIDLVGSGGCDIAFFQLPTKISQVKNIAANGDRMPHKSTYFYPKLLTGLVLNKP